jgi:GNAT superfamily N-acetyltransferase
VTGASGQPPASPLTIVPATQLDLGTLSQVIADAFHDLAPSRWLVTDPLARREVFPRYFRLYAEHALASGTIDTTPDRTAVALWIHNGDEPAAPPAGYPTRLAALAGPWISRFRDFDAVLERHHPTGVPHHHLAILAVHPHQQGTGIGTALLNAHHQALDRGDGTPAYLEASDQRTRRLYLRHGYTDHGPPIQLADGPRMYPMWRKSTRTATLPGAVPRVA